MFSSPQSCCCVLVSGLDTAVSRLLRMERGGADLENMCARMHRAWSVATRRLMVPIVSGVRAPSLGCDPADCGKHKQTQTMIDFLKEHVPEALMDRIEDEESDPAASAEGHERKAEL